MIPRMRRVARILRYTQACLLYATGLLWLAKHRLARRGVVVLTFHRVLKDDEFCRTSSLLGMCVREKTFEQFLGWAKGKFELLDLKEGSPEWDHPSNRLRIAITFDDGWLDNYHSAFQISQTDSYPATVFVCPGLMDTPFPFWPEQVSCLMSRSRHSEPSAQDVLAAIEQLKALPHQERYERIAALKEQAGSEAWPLEEEPSNRTMSWDQVEEVHRNGVAIGSHTVSHAILTTLAPQNIRGELTDSRQEIEAQLNDSCTLLAYPNGNHSGETRRVAREAGYQFAFTTQRGYWASDTDALRIPRVNVSEAKLTGLRGGFSRVMAEYCLFWDLPKGPIAHCPANAPQSLELQVPTQAACRK